MIVGRLDTLRLEYFKRNKEVIAEDSIPPNDADLGEEIRKHLI